MGGLRRDLTCDHQLVEPVDLAAAPDLELLTCHRPVAVGTGAGGDLERMRIREAPVPRDAIARDVPHVDRLGVELRAGSAANAAVAHECEHARRELDELAGLDGDALPVPLQGCPDGAPDRLRARGLTDPVGVLDTRYPRLLWSRHDRER